MPFAVRHNDNQAGQARSFFARQRLRRRTAISQASPYSVKLFKFEWRGCRR
jgi:hypothetical protein